MANNAGPTFIMVNDQTGEQKAVTYKEYGEGEGLTGFRILSPSAFEAARAAEEGPAPAVQTNSGSVLMAQQGAADASMVAMVEGDDSPDAKEAKKRAEASGFKDREQAVKTSSKAPSAEEVRKAQEAQAAKRLAQG